MNNEKFNAVGSEQNTDVQMHHCYLNFAAR